MKWLLLLLTLTACGGKTLVIESDTSWLGNLDGTGEIQGRGNAKYEVADIAPICWSIRKTQEPGTLRAYMDTKTWFDLGNEIEGLSTTTDSLGVVSGCVSIPVRRAR